jgi:hypothetical protein
MNYSYCGEPFLEVKFPTRNVKTALFRGEDVRKIIERTCEGKPLVVLYVKNATDERVIEWYFDGTMEEFKNNCTTIYL